MASALRHAPSAAVDDPVVSRSQTKFSPFVLQECRKKKEHEECTQSNNEKCAGGTFHVYALFGLISFCGFVLLFPPPLTVGVHCGAVKPRPLLAWCSKKPPPLVQDRFSPRSSDLVMISKQKETVYCRPRQCIRTLRLRAACAFNKTMEENVSSRVSVATYVYCVDCVLYPIAKANVFAKKKLACL